MSPGSLTGPGSLLGLIGQGLGSIAETPLGSGALDLLRRTGSAGLAAAADPAGRPFPSGLAAGAKTYVNALTQGRTRDQDQANLDTIKRDIGVKSLIDKLPSGLPRGIADFAVGAPFDVTNVLGGSGLIERGANALGNKAYVAGARGVQNLERVAPTAATLLQGAHNFVTPGGARMGRLKLGLAANEGQAGLDKYALARSIEKGNRNTQTGIKSTLSGMTNKATRPLTPEQEQAAYQAVDIGAPAGVPGAEDVDAALKGLRHLEGTGTVQADLAAQGFKLPDELQPFDTSVRGIQNRGQVREAYFPHFSPPNGEQQLRDVGLSLEQAAGTEPILNQTAGARGLDATDKSLLPRSDDSFLGDLATNRHALDSRFYRGARAIGAKDTMRDLAENFGEGGAYKSVPSDIRQAFNQPPAQKSIPDLAGELATGQPGAFGELLGRGAKAATRGTTASMFVLPGNPHFANELEMGLLSKPATTLGTTARYLASGEAIPGWMGRERIQQLPGVRDALAAQNASVGRALKSGATETFDESRVPDLFRKLGLGPLADYSNRTLWGYAGALRGGINDSFRKDFLSQGVPQRMAEAKAAERTGQDVVNYADKSDFNRLLQNFLPFATYATKKPGVIARAAIRHPERVNALTQRNPNFDPDRDEKMEGPDSGRPLSGIYNALNNKSPGSTEGPFPGAQYARASMGSPLRDVLGALGSHYFTYGNPANHGDTALEGWLKLLLSQTAGNIPGVGSNPIPGHEADTLLDKLGLNYFER